MHAMSAQSAGGDGNVASVAHGVIRFADAGGATYSARAKWFEFYRLLILRAGRDIDRNDLVTLKSWGGDPLGAGRDVARHLQSAKVQHLGQLTVVSAHPTKAWQIAPHWTFRFDDASLHDAPDIFKTVRADDDGKAHGGDSERATWTFAAIDALLLFYAGDLQAAHAAARTALERASTDDLASIALLLCVRIGWKLPIDDGVIDSIEDCEVRLRALPSSKLADHARRRLDIFKTLHARPDEWPGAASQLDVWLRQPGSTFDPATAAYTLNYAAVTRRRLGDLERASSLIADSIVDAVAAGDLYLLQTVLFNLGLIHDDLSRSARAGRSDADLAITAYTLVGRITRTHALGGDSAQNELAIAGILIRRGDLAGAASYLDEAGQIVARTQSSYDRAVLAHRSLQLKVASRDHARPDPSLGRSVDVCAELYAAVDRPDLAAKLKTEFRSRQTVSEHDRR